MSPSSDDLDLPALLELAVALARDAGALLLAGRDSLRSNVGTKSSATDMVTDMDRASEALIVEGLARARPHDGIVAEEGSTTDGTSGVVWVIDPLDGTTNYLYGHPTFAVSIAARADGRTVVGVVAVPDQDELYSAVAGGGATRTPMNAPRGAPGPERPSEREAGPERPSEREAGPERPSEREAGPERPSERGVEPLTASDATELATSLVATGFSYVAERRAAQGRVLARLLPSVGDVRRVGAAAVDLCWVAAGRVDAYYESGLQPWDLAAGALIAGEAGASVEGWDGPLPESGSVLAGAPALIGPLRRLLGPPPEG